MYFGYRKKIDAMNTMRNIYAVILSTIVLVVTVVTLLVIWDIIELDYKLLQKAFWSLVTIAASAGVIALIFNMLYRTSISPPKPPQQADSAYDRSTVEA